MMLGQTAIEDIQLDASCRDDIPAVLKGIQHIWCNHRLRERVCALLEEPLLATGASATKGDAAQTEDRAPVPGINPDVGRPGMELWRVLVLGLLKQGINCDYDRLHDLANQHGDVRRMLGISDVLGAETFSYRTLARNVALLTPELLAAVNRLAVEAGHELAGCRPDEPLQARCDSFAVETDVHWTSRMAPPWNLICTRQWSGERSRVASSRTDSGPGPRNAAPPPASPPAPASAPPAPRRAAVGSRRTS